MAWWARNALKRGRPHTTEREHFEPAIRTQSLGGAGRQKRVNAVGLPPDALVAAAAQLERSEAVVAEARRSEAVRRVAPPYPYP